jgi:kynurenine formamidase
MGITTPFRALQKASPSHARSGAQRDGVHLLDYLQLEDLVRQCEKAERWEFLFVAAPLRIERGTGSPLNPIAIF